VRRIVLDTNAFLDCWVFDDPAAVPLKRAIEAGAATPVRSSATDAELGAVLERPIFRLDDDARSALLLQWNARAALVEVGGSAPLRCLDPDDQKFLDLAFAVQARALFTKDKALLATASRARRLGLHVVPPHAADSVLVVEDRLA